MGFGNYEPIDSGVPPSEFVACENFVVCEPVLLIEGGIPGKMTCRRGTGSRSMFQGQPIPKCDGTLKPLDVLKNTYSCIKCNLTHATVVVNNVLRYGAVL